MRESQELIGIGEGRWSGAAARLPQYAFVLVGVGLSCVALSRFHIGSAAFRAALPWLGVGFAVHFWLPRRLQTTCFAALSVGGCVLVFQGDGPQSWSSALAASASLLALAGTWAAACMLRPKRGRFALLIGVTLLFCSARANFAHGMLEPVWPIVGGMLMFRSLLYVHETAHDRAPRRLAESVAYIFMLPALFFPLCPVIGWRMFDLGRADSSASDAKQWANYLRGLRWMTRGLIQIVCYRAILRYGYLEPERVVDGAGLAQYLLANYGLYLHVSGTFHLISGWLHLFGWAMPETNRSYALAESFTDYWRRVNIYWKEFILNLVFNPLVFRLRHRGMLSAVTAGSVVAFFVTWLLHGYQTFWLTGDWSLASADAAFWGLFALLVIYNGRQEARHPPARSLRRQVEWASLARRAVKTALVFAAICALWSVWVSTSWATWLSLWSRVDGQFFVWFGAALVAVALAKVAAELAAALGEGHSPHSHRERGVPLVVKSGVAAVICSGLLCIATDSRVQGAAPGLTILQDVMRPASDMQASAASRGYYERLFAATGNN